MASKRKKHGALREQFLGCNETLGGGRGIKPRTKCRKLRAGFQRILERLELPHQAEFQEAQAFA